MGNTAGSNAPGAMTLVMKAVDASKGPKVLRLGVYRGAELVEERVLRSHSAVTVGSREDNSLVVSGPDAPASFELFALREGRYYLRFVARLEGRLVHQGRVYSLAQLIASGLARAEGELFTVLLDEHSRGKVQLGESSVLFQFVQPPPVAPRSQLPRVLVRPRLERSDRVFSGCLAALIAVATGTLGWTEYGYDPEVGEVDPLAEVQFVASLPQLLPPPAAPAPAAATPDAQQDPAPEQPRADRTPAPAQPSARPEHDHPAHAPASPEHGADTAYEQALRLATRAGDIVQTGVLNDRTFASLNASLEGQGPTAAQMVAQGGMYDTVESLRNVQVGGARPPGVTRNLTAANAAGRTDIGRPGVVQNPTGVQPGTGLGPPVEIVRGHAVLTDQDVNPDGPGTIDADAVAHLIRRQIGGIQSCYDRILRQSPTLSGRLSLSFTVGGTGRIVNSHTSGMDEAPDMGRCVSNVVRGLVFPLPEGGAVNFTFPFNFTPGGR